MPRSSIVPRAALSALAFFALSVPSRAGTIAADALPLPNRVATADMVVVGRVTAFENQNVTVAPFPGAKNKVEFKIAAVTITAALVAAKEAKTVRLGYVPIPAGVAVSRTLGLPPGAV